MKRLEIEQNTPEWQQLRRDYIGASDCPIIMDASPYKGPNALWREKVLGEEGITTMAMHRGHSLEKEALRHHNILFGEEYIPMVVMSENNNWQMASLDGYCIGGDYILEIKCPNEELYLLLTKNNAKDIPEYWIWQAQHQMCVVDLKEVRFLVYHPKHGGHYLSVKRNDEQIEALIVKEMEFYAYMINYEEPPLGKRETSFKAREDDEWKKLALERFEIDELKKEVSKREIANKQAIINLANGEPSKGYGLTLSVQKGRTTIDYEAIPELQQIDLNPYKNISLPSWKITLSRKESRV